MAQLKEQLENMYMVFFENGTKELASSQEECDVLKSESKETVQFVTNAALDYPFDYDWDSKLGKWQSKLF